MTMLEKIEKEAKAGASDIVKRFSEETHQSKRRLGQISEHQLRQRLTSIALEVMFSKDNPNNTNNTSGT